MQAQPILPVTCRAARLKNAFFCKIPHETFDTALQFSSCLTHLHICYPFTLIKRWHKVVQECLFGRCQFFGNFGKCSVTSFGNFTNVRGISGKPGGSDSFERYDRLEYVALDQLRLITGVDFCEFIEITHPRAEFVRAADVQEKTRDDWKVSGQVLRGNDFNFRTSLLIIQKKGSGVNPLNP